MVRSEKDWMACIDPDAMLRDLRRTSKVEKTEQGKRKLRLFSCACYRSLWAHLKDERSRKVIEVAEQVAEGQADGKQLKEAQSQAEWAAEVAHESARQAFLTAWTTSHCNADATRTACLPFNVTAEAASAIYAVGNAPAWDAASAAATHFVGSEGVCLSLTPKERCALLRDLFGNPFHPAPAIDPTWLNWRGGLLPRLAQAIYEEKALSDGTLDRGRFTILADALEEAGCAREEMLSHCRGPGPHVRGCWVLDQLLRKE
jgi:hypothetical protein